MPASLMVLLLGSSASAQDGPELVLTPLLDVRPRAVFTHTDGLARGFLDEASALERARVGVRLERAGVSGFVGVQEYRGWEFDDDLDAYRRIEPTFEAYEAWARLEGSLPGDITAELTAGRQLLTLHTGRLVSDSDFSFCGQPLDALALGLGLGDVDFFAANFRDFADPSSLDDPGATAVRLGVGRGGPVRRWQVDAMYLLDFFEDAGRHTLGPVVSVAAGRWELDLEGYVQTLDLEPDPDAVSLLVDARTGAVLGPERLLTLAGGYAIQTSNLAGTRPAGFHAPAGDVYAFWGHMNLFQRPEDTGHRGLQDLSIRLAARPRPSVALRVDGHAFWLQREAQALGTELDGTVELRPSPIGALEAGLMQYWAGPGLAAVTNEVGPFRTGYVQVRVGSPEVFGASADSGRRTQAPRR